MKFGEKTRDCSPGQAGKEVPNLAMTVGFPELRRQCGAQSLFKMATMKSYYDYNTFNNETSKLVNDSLLGAVSKDYFLTFSYGDDSPTIDIKLLDRENDHQIMSNLDYEIGIVMVPNFYRWSTDSIMAETTNEVAVKKNKMQVRINYITGELTSKGKPSEKLTDKLTFEYAGERVDTIWIKNEDGSNYTLRFPVSYKNIDDSYPTMNITSAAKRSEVGAGKEYQHTFSIDRIILRAKE